MQHIVKYEPTFSMLQVNLAPGEVIIAEAGSMVARSSNLAMEVKLNAGRNAGFFGKMKAVFIALLRKLVGGETFFVNHFSSPQGGWVWLAPSLSGGIRPMQLAGNSMIFSAGAYLASAGEVDLKMRWGGLRAILSKEGAFFIEASGNGQVFVTSYGAIEEIHCNGSYIVDNGHIVGFDSSLNFKIRSAGGGLMGFMASGEGLVCEFQGQGRIFIQTRNTSSLVDWITPMLPP
ncbi:TIGR00266 family protein [Polyangium aurulentum]|uniref:TIGR00266 family protein n=1 Tax=Polyangium aurulentum TaxID=2567896 RepID=UPI0010ADF33D|nr:TIGR00266 family protein [Polyangium aurulentum]UQA63283.1 TIGR00266 family protein [Polyangium aurulentum]